jgi:hypothetical protein
LEKRENGNILLDLVRGRGRTYRLLSEIVLESESILVGLLQLAADTHALSWILQQPSRCLSNRVQPKDAREATTSTKE